MPITPYDMLTLIPRTNEVSHINQVEMQRPAQEQAQINVAFKNEIQHEMKKTIQSQKSEKEQFRYDAKEKGNGQNYENRNKKQNKKSDSKTNVPTDPTRGSFDIKI